MATQAKVADFGLSRSESAYATVSQGNCYYLPPEVFCGEEYTTAADTYSFAVLLWEVLTGSPPHAALKAQRAAYQVAVNGLRPSLDAPLAGLAHSRLTSCRTCAHDLHEESHVLLKMLMKNDMLVFIRI